MGPAHCHEQLLSELDAAASDLGDYFDRWFWLRYSDQAHGPHIRARFHGDPAVLGGHLLPVLSDWCAAMVTQRLTGGFAIEPYDQEIERCGGIEAIQVAEQVFAADSRLVLRALAATSDTDQRLVIAARSAVTVAHTVADSNSAALHGPKLDRAARRRVTLLRAQLRASRTRDDIPGTVDDRPRMVSAPPGTQRLPRHCGSGAPCHVRILGHPHARQPAPRQHRYRTDGTSTRPGPDALPLGVMNTRQALSQQRALATAERLLDPAVVLASTPGPAGASLADGLAGTALLHARLSTVDRVFALAAARHWATCAMHTHRVSATGGGILGSSHAGLAASLIVGSPYLPDADSQRTVTARAVRWLCTRATSLANHYDERLRTSGVGTPWPIYDAINGLAGVGRVLLAAITSGHGTAEPGLLAALRTLTTMIHEDHGGRPGWWLAAEAHPATVAVDPSGAATTGMAHGIAGPVSLLATAQGAGWSVPRSVRGHPARDELAAALARQHRTQLGPVHYR